MVKMRLTSASMWLGMLLLAVVPFLSSWRIGPQGGWLIESGSFLFAALFAALSAALIAHKRVSDVAVYALLLAAFWAWQGRMVAVPYTSLSDLTAIIWLGMALLAWACGLQVASLGQQKAADIFAWALVAGAVLQGMVCVLQFAEQTAWIPGLMNAPGQYFVFGQVGQRNHLGHYLMWGILALAYLWGRGQCRPIAAWPLTVFLLGIIGLVTSRTILLYLLVLFVLLPILYWRGDESVRHGSRYLAAMLCGILIAQLTVLPILSLLLSIDVQASGVAKMASGQTESIGRRIEWLKAWYIFLSHPMLGAGWLGQAGEAFALTETPRSYDVNVLFTHSHNSYLQILAETGLVGGLLIFGGFAVLLYRRIKTRLNASTAWLLCCISVSLCHSLMEYPLWYVYFLAPFIVMLALSQPAPSQAHTDHSISTLIPRIAIILLSLYFCWQTIDYGHTYYRLTQAYGNPTAKQSREQQIDTLQQISQSHRLLEYYAHMGLIRKINLAEQPLPTWGRDPVYRATQLRPYPNTFIYAAYLEQNGQHQQAHTWLTTFSRYYPNHLTGHLKTLREQNRHQLADILAQECHRQHQHNNRLPPDCQTPP